MSRTRSATVERRMAFGVWTRKRADRRYARVREIQAMNVRENASKIWWLDMGYEFPWDYAIAGALGFYHSIAPPEIAALLVRTGELTGNTERRMEHLGIITLEMVRRGFRDPRGKAAVRRMNQIHRNAVRHISVDGETWTITNEQYLFVLATSMLIQARWVDRYGWRPLSAAEHAAAYLHAREQSEHMGLKDMPGSWEELGRFHDDYVRRHFIYSPEAAKLFQATKDALIGPMIGWLPARWARLGRRLAELAVPAILPPELRTAFGVAEPSAPLRLAVHLALRARAAYVRATPPRTEPAYPEKMPTPTFPDGEWDLGKVGPAHTVRSDEAVNPPPGTRPDAARHPV